MTKTFGADDGERCAREWHALTLLATWAPGLAPEPVSHRRTAAAPSVVMSRLAGVPLRGQPLGPEPIAALADTVRALHGAVPADVLAGVPPRPGGQRELVALVRTWAASLPPDTGRAERAALDAGLAWLTRSGLEHAGEPDVPAVFGQGDGNLANHLWDGETVRLVDFEDSGRSDRAFELAEITEHVSGWVEHPLDVPGFLGRFELTAAEAARLADCRRLLALVWLFLLLFDARRDHPRNPPGTAERQAGRLLGLLG